MSADLETFIKEFKGAIGVDESLPYGDDAALPPIDIPDFDASNISIESTIKEITHLTNLCHKSLQKNPNNQIMLSKLCTLLEVKCRMLGMYNVKPDVQQLIDNETNTYKRRFIEVAAKLFTPDDMNKLCTTLSGEGL